MNPLPLLYHAHHMLHTEDIPFWLELAHNNPGPILELGCGTGRVLLPLAQAGHPVIGLDRDPAMLAYLKHTLQSGLVGQIHLVRADMAAFAFSCRFNLILLPCNTFSTLSTESRQRVLELASYHLAPGGNLAVSLPNPEVIRRMPAVGEPEVEEVFAHPLDGEPVQVISTWQRTKGKFHLTWHYDHLLADGRVERTSLKTSHDLAPFDRYLAQIDQAGLQLVASWGNYDASDYTRRSELLILLATRKGF